MKQIIWYKPTQLLPSEGAKVVWISPSGYQVTGVYKKRLWFSGDVYIYYTPEFWRYE